jgi:hypothetical protein
LIATSTKMAVYKATVKMCKGINYEFTQNPVVLSPHNISTHVINQM